MPDTLLHSQPEPPRFAAASQALAAVLAGPVELETRLAIGRALLILGDVFPPYPPLDIPAEPVTAEMGLDAAIAELTAVVESRGAIGETVRAGRAVRELRAVRPAP